MYSIITQLIGIVAYGILMISYWKKTKLEILFVQIFASIIFGIHYYLLDGITATICNMISVLVLVYIFLIEKKNIKTKWNLVLISAMFVLTGVFTYENIFSIFPIIACILPLSSFLSSNENTIRICGILGNSCWIIYAIIYGSYSGMICEALTIITTIIAMIKLKRIKNEEI